MGDNVRAAGRIGKEYIQEVNGTCDRILWRGKVYPLKQIKGMTLYRIDPRDLMHLSVAKSEGYFATDCKDTIPPEALRSLRIVIDTLERAERIDLLRADGREETYGLPQDDSYIQDVLFFKEDQWWVQALDEMVEKGTPVQGSAMMVVRSLLRSAHAMANYYRTPKKPVVVSSGALADEMNAQHGERYGIDWVYAHCEDEESRCHGEKCTTTNGRNHSVECLFGHFSSYTGAHNETPEVLEKLRKAYFDGYGAGKAYEHPQTAEKQQPVAEVVSMHGDPEAFGERMLSMNVDIQTVPYGTKFYTNQQPCPECERLKALSVTNILLDVAPGDGSGLEIYAKSVSDVEALISRLGEKAEDYDLLKPEYEKMKVERDELKRETLRTVARLADVVHERNTLAKAIRDAAVSAGVCREDADLTGPHLVLLCIDMGIALSNRCAEGDEARLGRKHMSLQVMGVMVEATAEAFDLEIINAHNPEVHTVRKTKDAVLLRLDKIIKEVEGG